MSTELPQQASHAKSADDRMREAARAGAARPASVSLASPAFVARQSAVDPPTCREFYFTERPPEDGIRRSELVVTIGTIEHSGGWADRALSLLLSVDLCVPCPDEDDDRTAYVALDVYRGELGPIQADSAFLLEIHPSRIRMREIPEHIPIATVVQITDSVANALRFGATRGLSYATPIVLRTAQRALEERLFRIDQSVHRALEDDVLTDDDEASLRRFPERLARLARVADSVGGARILISGADAVVTADIDVDAFRSDIRRVAVRARESMATLASVQVGRQIALSQRQAHETEKLQRTITLLGAGVLVPSVVAGVFGTNVAFPGANSKAGFWAMLLFMAAGAAASFGVIRAAQANLMKAPRRWVGALLGSRDRVVPAVLLFLALALAVAVYWVLASSGTKPH
jgi:CorA-like Mg2+ transporter protein